MLVISLLLIALHIRCEADNLGYGQPVILCCVGIQVFGALVTVECWTGVGSSFRTGGGVCGVATCHSLTAGPWALE